MTARISNAQIERSYAKARDYLLGEMTPDGHWEGELSTSALSTATAVMALEMVRRQCSADAKQYDALIDGGIAWLVAHQNVDGGWGDTTKSISNISTTMLCHAVFHATGMASQHDNIVSQAAAYIEGAGGVPALVARYGKDRTFSVPILTHCALAELVDWKDVVPLPFELAAVPARFYKTVRLPVVSYALPALIAIGQARHFHRKTRNPLTRILRDLARKRTLRILESIQPANGGFLEAAPLTSFVTMSLASMGLIDHPVTQRGLQFLLDSVRPDGSWPIDTNLATWVTTLSVNALGDDLPEEHRERLLEWLLDQQYREVHPYTNADPGGWAWTNLPGGVPDADDTPGAMLAVMELGTGAEVGSRKSEAQNGKGKAESGEDNNRLVEQQKPISSPTSSLTTHHSPLGAAALWLLDLQNGDGGWPTFCRGWGTLPFDRSAPDLTAHAIRALSRWISTSANSQIDSRLIPRTQRAIENGFRYLSRTQRTDGSWLPLWFGNQFAHDDENPVYGTSKVLAAYRDTGRLDSPEAQQGLAFLQSIQNEDGGWGGAAGIASSCEETALAADVLLSSSWNETSKHRALSWLVNAVEEGTFTQTTPIGFYFAKLWYFERLYPVIFTVAALSRARSTRPSSGFSREQSEASETTAPAERLVYQN